ncbi:uncharacterized protein J4E87_007670 [Alternaria ethzedia]|uniref:uncharacterized protein n=1 Tax=Alternaria ethzedia TaxID=181014 RepID=UPI0020C4F90D|nr:uncharacterized protein J4E87_007670 [Alternaria ethzedia]KAI4619083.1 hypothetical protein J4E87_007670 [Alternaria ethzedia]
MTTVNPEIVDTLPAIVKLVDQLISTHEARNDTLDRPIIHLSLEGANLCRSGTISILTLLLCEDPQSQQTYLVDVHKLGAYAFSTVGTMRTTLKDILQNGKIPKVFFDVRNDSDALFARFGIALQGVQDVQLMDSAAREKRAEREYLSGLPRCVEHNSIISFHRRNTWCRDRTAGELVFRVEFGGSREAFSMRPLADDIVSYCVGDVMWLPELRNKLWETRTQEWRDFVRDETERRVAYTHGADYQPGGTDWVLAPWKDEQNRVLDRLNGARDFDGLLDDDEVDEDVE